MSEILVIALDADQAGFKAATRSARAALQAGMQVKVAQLPQGSDPADLISKEGAEAWRTVIRGAKDIVTFLLDVLEVHAKDTMQLRRSVESIVLPFLLDMQSPIAREQYENEIAKRLGVSVDAVRASASKVPQPPPQPVAAPVIVRPADVPNRIQQAYGFLLWQESLTKPVIDTDTFARELGGAVGDETMEELRRMPLEQKETLRFFAEHLHAKNGSLPRMATTLLSILRRDRLSAELQVTTDKMREAEAQGDEAAVSKLEEEARTLTTVIAKMTE
jgi:DNA primase